MTASPLPDPRATRDATLARAHARAPGRALPAVTMPWQRDDRRVSGALSLVIHILIIALLLTPVALHTGFVTDLPQGAGGAGPVGGGGGGTGGTGGAERAPHETLRFIRVAPPPLAAPTVAPPKVQPAVVPPAITPPPRAAVTPQTPAITPPAVVPTPAVVATTTGTGGGAGNDGTQGSGPGSGGGVGAGTGTGRGSGTGPGTGGGTQENFPPMPQFTALPPEPVPGSVRGTKVVAEFDVDSTGRVLSYTFTPTRDRGYNRKLDEIFREFRFKPGTRPDGTPIRMKVTTSFEF